jgi:hypothetical protein
MNQQQKQCLTEQNANKKMKQLTLFTFATKLSIPTTATNEPKTVQLKQNEAIPTKPLPDIIEPLTGQENVNPEENLNLVKKQETKPKQHLTTQQYFENLMGKKPKVEDKKKEEADIAGHLLFSDKHGGLPNGSFGDIMSIIESYNCYLKLYETIMGDDWVQSGHRIKLSTIDYNLFVDELLANKTDLFYDIVETLLSIILDDEDYFNKCHMFNVNVAKAYKANNRILNRLTMQEFCRVVIQLDEYLYEEINGLDVVTNNHNNNNCLQYEPHKVHDTHRPLVKSLHETSLDSFNLQSRLCLMHTLCCIMLNSSVFYACLSELRAKVTDENNKINALKADLVDYETRKKTTANGNQSTKSTKTGKQAINNDEQYENKSNKLHALKSKQKEMKEFLSKCDRLVPIGNDNQGNTYWSFDSLPGVLVREHCHIEQQTTGYATSTWYVYNSVKGIKTLIRHIGKSTKSSPGGPTNNSKLIAKLNEFEKALVARSDATEASVKMEQRKSTSELEREDRKLCRQLESMDFVPRRSSRSAANAANQAIRETTRSRYRGIDVDDQRNNDESDNVNEDNAIYTQNADIFEAYLHAEPSMAVYDIVNGFCTRLLSNGIVCESSCATLWTSILDNAKKANDFEELKDLLSTVLTKLRRNCFSPHANGSIFDKDQTRQVSLEDYVRNSKIQSQVILAVYLINMNINWQDSAVAMKTHCKVCSKNSLTSYATNAYVVCLNCSTAYHQKCCPDYAPTDESNTWTCNYCCKTKSKQNKPDSVPIDASPKLVITSKPHDNNRLDKRRRTTEKNYCEDSNESTSSSDDSVRMSRRGKMPEVITERKLSLRCRTTTNKS